METWDQQVEYQRPHTSYQSKNNSNTNKQVPYSLYGVQPQHMHSQKLQLQKIQSGKGNLQRYQNYNQTIQYPSITKSSNAKIPSLTLGNKQSIDNNNVVIIPKVIQQDKEQLYQELQYVKKHLHQLEEENIKLKTKIQNLERENLKIEKQLEGTSPGSSKQIDLILQLRLKKQLKETQKKLEEKEKEIEAIQKNQKQTKIEELEFELEMYQGQLKKTKFQLEQSVRVNEKLNLWIDKQIIDYDEKKRQLNINASLKNDNLEMASLIKEYTFQIEQMNSQQKVLEREINQANKEKYQARKEYMELEKEYKKIHKGIAQQQVVIDQQYQIKTQSANPNSQDDNNKIKEQIEKKNKEIQQLEMKSNNRIKELEEKVCLLEKKNQDQVEIDKKEYDKLKYKFEEQSNKVQQQEFQVKQLTELVQKNNDSNKNQDNNKKSTQKEFAHNKNVEQVEEDKYGQDEDFDKESSQRHQKQKQLTQQSDQKMNDSQQFEKKTDSSQNLFAKRKLHKVSSYDIEKVSNDLKFTLILKKIKYVDIEKYLMPEGTFDNDNNQISIMQVYERFQQEPFNVKNEQSAMLIARYLVEENQDDYIMFDPQRSMEVRMVKDIFKKLIGKYDLMDTEKYNQIQMSIAEKLTSYQPMMIDTIKGSIMKKQKMGDGICNFEEFDQAIKYSDCNLTKDDFEFIKLKNYEFSNDTDIIYYLKVFQFFNLENINKNQLGENPSALQEQK